MKKIAFFSAALLLSVFSAGAQDSVGYQFTKVVSVPTTPVKNQASSGTCWCFASTSFIESELLRKGKGEHDLSEMYVVRTKYGQQLDDNYLRRGRGNIGQGSIGHIYLRAWDKGGVVPEEVYSGINYDSKTHNHGELTTYMSAIADGAIKMKKRSPEYDKLVNSLFDIYLGPVPEKFTYQGKEYTPQSFAKSLGINTNDYVELTSFTHHPFYEEFQLEIPDNWDNASMYNVPLDELMQTIDNALTTGYTVCWDGDVSEKGFSHKNGVAILPAATEQQELEEIYKFKAPAEEANVTQESRQKDFETFTTTDDHLMHLTGIVKDQNGKKYYVTKNSWGTERNDNGGYLNMSEPYVRAKTVSVMLHKDAIPAPIRKKLGI